MLLEIFAGIDPQWGIAGDVKRGFESRPARGEWIEIGPRAVSAWVASVSPREGRVD